MYETAREFFEAARLAAEDAERIRFQLAEMEERAAGVGGGGFEPRVASTGEPDRMGARVASAVDHRARLEARQAEDYRLIDAACAILYGHDNDGGLWALVGWRADAIFHRYLGLMTWDETARAVHFHKRYVQVQVQAAFEVADAMGCMRTTKGLGIAEGETWSS